MHVNVLKFICLNFKDKYRLNVNENPKAKLRLLSECEKLKRLMSANTTEIPMNIECLMNDRDVSARMKRYKYVGTDFSCTIHFTNTYLKLMI